MSFVARKIMLKGTISGSASKILYAWGSDLAGQLGINDEEGGDWLSPVQVGTSSWTSVSAGGFFHTLAITS